MERLKFHQADPQSPCVGWLRGTLSMELTVESGQLCCREQHSRLRVPLLSSLPPASDLAAVRAFLAECAASFQPRIGLRLAVAGRGGGGCCCRSEKIAVPPSPHPLPSEDPFNYKENKERDSSNQTRASQLAEKVLALAQQGVVEGMELAELEDMPLVSVPAPIAIARRLLEALHQEAVWSLPAYFLVRHSLARLARKFLMDHIFMDRNAFFTSSRTEIQQQLTETLAYAHQQDSAWPESGALSQLHLIGNLLSYSNDTTSWWEQLVTSAKVLLEVYTSRNPLLVLPLASQLYPCVSSLLGRKHLVETQLFLDSLYVAFRMKQPGVEQVVADLLVTCKGWKCVYGVLACVEWAAHRELLTSAQLQLLWPHFDKMTVPSLGIKRRGWRVLEKLASLLAFLSVQESEAQKLLARLQEQEHNSVVGRVLKYFALMQPEVEPSLPEVSNIDPPADFKGRTTELEALSEQLLTNKAVTLVGPAGVGKSALADALACSLKAFKVRWKCHAESPAAFKADLMELHERLGLGKYDRHKLLSSLSTRRCLLVLDNLEEALPEMNELRKNAWLLITTRDSAVRSDFFCPVPVKGLELSTALDLLVQLSGRKGEREELRQLCEELSCFPLSLHNAGALLKENSTFSVQDVLADVVKTTTANGKVDGKQVHVLQQCIEEAVKTKGVHTLLLIAALLSPDGIPDTLYSGVFKAVETNGSLLAALGLARNYSLISSDHRLLSMHRFVQHVVLSSSEPATVFAEAALQLNTLLQIDWSQANKVIYRSAQRVAERLCTGSAVPLPSQVELCVKVAYFQAKILGEVESARPLVEQCERWIGSPKNVKVGQQLAQCLLSLGELQRAAHWGMATLKLAEETLPRSKCAQFYNDLAIIMNVMGDFERAREYALKDIAISEEVLGPKHPDLATSFSNLAMIMKAMRDFEGAQEYALKSIAIREEVLGPKHPDLAVSYSNYAAILRALKDTENAEKFEEMANQVSSSR